MRQGDAGDLYPIITMYICYMYILQISQMQQNLSIMHSKKLSLLARKVDSFLAFSVFTLIEMTKISIIQSLRLEVKI